MNQKIAYGLGATGVLAMAMAIYRMINLPLWGHWPMILGLGFCLLIIPVFLKRGFTIIELSLAAGSGILMGISFAPSPFPFLSMVGLVPILWLIDHISLTYKRRTLSSIWVLSFWSFLIWNIISTFWVMNTALAAGIFANVVNSFLMTLPIVGYTLIRRMMSDRYHWIAWMALWVLFEYGHFNWDLHWPWLTLGNAFASWPWAIQWYEWTGVLGGSAWILVMNYWVHHAATEASERKYALAWIVSLLIIPLAASLFIGSEKLQPYSKANVVIIQPNFEPHYEKFDFSRSQQIQKIQSQIGSAVNDSTDWLILPETVFTVRLNEFDQDPAIIMLRSFLDRYPRMQVITGLATQRILDVNESSNQFTRTFSRRGKEFRWEAGNAALLLQPNGYEIYYKSKLVPGAEFFPYYQLLFFMEKVAKELGGSIEGFRMQKEREVFKGKGSLGPIICYESIFGEFVREYVAKGADALVIMTNDGWWDNTAGHKQHLAYAQIRAIEQRRAIARAANTGISAIVLPDETIQQASQYADDAVITGQLPLHKKVTFYARWGDLTGRASLFIVIVLILQFLYNDFQTKLGNRTKA